MYRNLHITIHEAARTVRRRVSGRRSGAAGWDPTDTEYAPPEPTSPTDTEYAPPEPTSPGDTQYAAAEPTSPTDTEYAPPEPTSPGDTEYAPPEPTSPEGGGWGGAGYGVHACAPGVTVHEGTARAAAGCCCCSCAAPSTANSRPGLAPRDYSGFVIVRLRSGVPLAYRSLWELAGDLGLTALDEVLKLPAEHAAEEDGGGAPAPEDEAAERTWREPEGVLVSRPLIEMPIQGCENETRERFEVIAAIEDLERAAAGSGLAPLHSLASYWRVDLRPYPELVDEVVEGFARLAQVDLAYRELSAENPINGSTIAGESFSEDQAYLEDAPVGIAAGWAWGKLSSIAPTLTVCDLEQGWSENHQEVDPDVYQKLYFGANRAVDVGDRREGQHGNAVLGQLAARGQGPFGIEGAAARVASFALSSHYRSRDEQEWDDQKNEFVPHPFAGTKGHVAAAIANALAAPSSASTAPPPLTEGDVLLLEVQRALLPTEIDAADFDAIRLAAALGVSVVEAGGNGGRDLDRYVDPDTGRSLNRGSSSFRDSCAIVVGACRAALPHDRAGFSNYGSRVDCFAWGEGVTSCGYGDLAGTKETELYTNTFSGTSSASPIVAGAAALVQALYWSASGNCWIKPLSLRKVLSDPANGTRQGPNVGGHIGVMPDLGAIVRNRLGLVPDVYMRRFVGDGGERPASSVELGSSPDILNWGKNRKGTQQRFGDRLLYLNTPAPGRNVRPGVVSHTYVRLFNRGGGDGKAELELYASSAATLITPERWQRIGAVEASSIPQGDTPVLAGPWKWTPGDTKGPVSWPDSAAPAHSLLAVLRPPAPSEEWDPEVLPPGPPYFDWSEFRRFLRGPRAAWRNAHRVEFTGGQRVSVGFYIAGAPDQGRTFDLQVLERMPAKAEVSLLVPKAFAQKLRQRQSWLGADWVVDTDSGWYEAALPARSRLDLGRLQLACGARIPAVFRVTLSDDDPPTGHSLAIRQLWRGEEVGRITWWFVTKVQSGGPGVGNDPIDS